MPVRPIVGTLPQGGHRLTVLSNRERGSDSSGRSVRRLRGSGNVGTAGEVKDAVVVDRDEHQLGVSVTVEAPREEPATRRVRFADDLDGLDVAVAGDHIDVVNDEKSARQGLVVVGADDREIGLADDVTGRLPTPDDRLEAFVRCAFFVFVHAPQA